ncbi:MAG: hypothetical protein RIG84_20440 [Roseovarius sp.]
MKQARRSLTIALHWGLLLLMIFIIAGASSPWVFWAFALSGFAMSGLALPFGLMSGPGPALEGALRALHPWMHRAMYLYLALLSAITLKALLTGEPAGRDLLIWYYALAAATALHSVFHLWRHTGLGDGALRRITPKAIHHML